MEFQGKDLEEAIAKAAGALNLPPEKVKFAVISMGAKGFLGLGRRQARISVNPDDPTLDHLEDDAPPAPAGATQAVPDGRRARPDQPPRTARPEARAKAEERPAAKGGRAGNSAPSRDLPPPANRRDQSGPSRNQSRKNPEPPKPETPPADPGERRSKSEKPPAESPPLKWSHVPPPPTRPAPGETLLPAPEDPLWTTAVAVTEELLRHLGLEAAVSGGAAGDRLIISLDGPDNALLIGARGATLEALQLLVAKITARRLAGRDAPPADERRLIVDAADYRARRQAHLLETLKTLAEQVRRHHRPQTLGGLNSAERRLIQTALRPYKDLAVQSGGRDSLVISPHGGRHHRRPRPSAPAKS